MRHTAMSSRFFTSYRSRNVDRLGTLKVRHHARKIILAMRWTTLACTVSQRRPKPPEATAHEVFEKGGSAMTYQTLTLSAPTIGDGNLYPFS